MPNQKLALQDQLHFYAFELFWQAPYEQAKKNRGDIPGKSHEPQATSFKIRKLRVLPRS